MSDTTARRAYVNDIGDLYRALRNAGMHPNCDRGTPVVIDLPDGQSRKVESVTYQEDLAGALVIKAGGRVEGVAPVDEMVERLYDLDRAGLRRLAWEALLIADGPSQPVYNGDLPAVDAAFDVSYSPGMAEAFVPESFTIRPAGERR